MKKRTMKKIKTKFLTAVFYGSIGFLASIALFLVFYWSLSLNSSIYSFINNTKSEPVYLWSYAILTFGTIILFGVNASLFVYRWRKFGPPRLKVQGGSGLGALVGVAASACPICGSVLLSAIGIAGGLAVFPLQGLELKALAFGLIALPAWLTTRELKTLSCGDETCPTPHPTSFRAKDKPYLIASFISIIILGFVGWNMLKTDPIVFSFFPSAKIFNLNDNKLNTANPSLTSNKTFDEVTAKVLPETGFQSKIVLSDSVRRLAAEGVIDKDKFEAIYKDRGGLPDELKDVFTKPSNRQILLTRNNSNFYVNLLWPLGLSNYMSTNKDSPVNGKSLFNFASTGGWNIGKAENGGTYFNKFKIVELTPEQEAVVTKIAKNTYRPCCNNSTFFQDCNHGSALLGLLQLGASQGLTEDELYRETLAFNSFWFPNNYIQTALYFKAVENIDWENVNPKTVMDKVYSSASGANLVAKKVNELGLVPQTKGGAGCGV